MRERNAVIGVGGLWLVVLCGLCACGDSAPAKKKGALLLADPEIGWRQSAQHAERSPISLTASDGSGLQLVSVKARTVIEDPLAFTELHLVFNNPEPRRREGRFEITLPQEAAISRFAMRNGDQWQEGEVVPRRRAQQVYEDFLHRKQDPALLEKDAGNEFAARVFPIEASADKELIVSYSEELAKPNEPYRLLLQGLPVLHELDVQVLVGSASATGKESSDRKRAPSGQLQIREQDHVPSGDIEVRVPPQEVLALRSDELVVARVCPKLSVKQDPVEGLTVLFDTSASRALGLGAQIERLAALVGEMRARTGKDFELRVIAFDQDTEELYRGPASGFGLREQTKLLERDALGASNLAQALTALAMQPSRHPRVLVVSDGVVTAGEDDTTALREAVVRLAAHGVTRLDALAEGGIQDRAVLEAITRAGLSSPGTVLDSHMSIEELTRRMLDGVHVEAQAHIANAAWLYPRKLEALQAGDCRIVFAEVSGNAPIEIEIPSLGAQAFEPLETPRPLLARAIARAKIADMSAELRALRPDADERAALEDKIVQLSVRERVVSDYTALLVLESDADYRRFGIEQNALANILKVGDEGLELVDRDAPAVPPPSLRDERMRIAAEAPEEESDKMPAAAPTSKSASAAPPPAPAPTTATEASAQPMAEASKPQELARAKDDAPKGLSDLGSLGTIGSGSTDVASIRNRQGSGSGSGRGALSGAGSGEGGASLRTRSAAGPVANKPAKAEAERVARRPRGMGEPDSLDGDPEDMRPTPAPRPRPQPDQMLEIAAPLEPRANVSLRTVQGLTTADATAVLRGALKARAQRCVAQTVLDPGAVARLVVEMSITDKGTVSDAYKIGGTLTDSGADACVLNAARGLRFPKPGANASVGATVELTMKRADRTIEQQLGVPSPIRSAPKRAKVPTPGLEEAYDGALYETLMDLGRGDTAGALTHALDGHRRDPSDVTSLIALGEVLEATKDLPRAARAYGSIIDLFPSRADLRRMAGGRLERLQAHAPALELAIDSYQRAVEQRPDHPSGHRMLAYALLKHGEPRRAFEALERGAERSYAVDRFEGVGRILREDLAIIGAAWLRAAPQQEASIKAMLAAHGVDADTKSSLRFVLSWETDANDVDFHIYDGRGGHAFYQRPKLGSGGSLYADITTGYGPECFMIPGGARARAYPFTLQAHYFARGPMGYGMGTVQAIDHDGEGTVRITDHPFVIMKDKAFVQLAKIEKGD